MLIHKNIDWISSAVSRVTYNPDTGAFVWLARPVVGQPSKTWNTKYAGRTAGSLDSHGYNRIGITINGISRSILAHRLAWTITHGRPPDGEIDHINRIKTDNRIVNLRDVSRSTNARNATMRKDNASGVSGVYWNKIHGKWQAQVTVNTTPIFLGEFIDIEQASCVVNEFRNKNGFSDGHGLARPHAQHPKRGVSDEP